MSYQKVAMDYRVLLKTQFKNLKARVLEIPCNNRKSVLILLLLFSFLFGCNNRKNSPNKSVHSRLNNKELRHFSNGRQLYLRFCSNCHMENGQGLGQLIPPLKDSDYLLSDVVATARSIKYGLKGPIRVNEVEYNQPMPANPSLTSLEIMELLIYISNAWGNKAPMVTLADVENQISERP